MKDIAIYGAGGLGREIACTIKNINNVNPEWNLIGFFDDGESVGKEVYHFGKVLGGFSELNAWRTELNVVLCFGNPTTMKSISQNITNPNILFPNIVDPSFFIADDITFSMGRGNIIARNCGVTTDVHLGDFNLLNSYVHIGHNTRIGNYNTFMPDSRISGDVIIGDGNLFGGKSFVKQQLRIGDNVTLSPLSALLTKPKNGMTYIGNPAKVFKF